MSYLKENLEKKWGPLLDHKGLPKIGDAYKRAVTAVLLENQESEAIKAQGIQGQSGQFLTEDAPSTSGFGGANLKGFDPILIALVRRSMPNLIAYDICGVQPMSGPTGLIFALKSNYANTTSPTTEALFQEANTAYSAAGAPANTNSTQTSSHVGTTPTGVYSTYDAANPMLTLFGEGLGTANSLGGYPSTNPFPEMSFTIDKVTATAGSRALKAEYSVEIAQDLKAVHNLDAETELANILSTEILAEINREIVRKIGRTAVTGAQGCATAGTFDLDVDSNGRWSVEKFKGLFFQIEREANAIAKQTRRGRGNLLITSSDVASALVAAGVLDHTPAYNADLTVDDTGSTFAGVLQGRYKVFIDPYAPVGGVSDYFIAGFKGSSPYDAGLFYCPYVPLQMYRAVDPNSFVPKIGFKTRYATVANPFCLASGSSDGTIQDNVNVYYRRVFVNNIF